MFAPLRPKGKQVYGEMLDAGGSVPAHHRIGVRARSLVVRSPRALAPSEGGLDEELDVAWAPALCGGL